MELYPEAEDAWLMDAIVGKVFQTFDVSATNDNTRDTYDPQNNLFPSTNFCSQFQYFI